MLTFDAERLERRFWNLVEIGEVCARARSGESVQVLAAEFGIDWSQVYRWLRGEVRSVVSA